MDDGKIMLELTKVNKEEATALPLTPGKITSRKGVVIRGKEFGLPAITEEDKRSIDFAIKNSLEYIGLSYVRRPEDIIQLRKTLKEKNANEISIMAKIETVSGIKNLDRIIKESDMILVARGDLGMQFPLEEIPALQQKIIQKSYQNGTS